MTKIIALGNEEFTLGFELVGIESGKVENIEKYFQKTEDIGIIIISSQDYETLSLKIKNQIDKSLKPIVIILSKDDIKGNNLRDMIIKALGVDLLKK